MFAVARSDRWHFVSPDGASFLSIGVVHADDTNLRYRHNIGIFTARYGGSRQRWLSEGLVPEMTSWGFNTLGWTSEYVSGSGWLPKPTSSTSATLPVYPPTTLPRWAFRTPCRCALPRSNSGTVTRPTAIHGRRPSHSGATISPGPCAVPTIRICWGGISWSTCRAGIAIPRARVGHRTSSRPSPTPTTAPRPGAIRRHDPHHLILGDRYGTRRGVPDAVLDAMAPYVDVLSVQTFPGPTRAGWTRP